ncbi:tRNA (adenosine(37)-N6)-dimethylallyltransferase MiaA [Alkalicoccus halolimnae]|uniref:tRNA dimethylallyltransferase n=1 Tax=Alkalicoccus halolimnae TaxID=1667239 RepID=A0A5C7FCV2_9BACI|nr:tRNA (adenosine(37)-N6)-dimethylallyltransferase MiaA [Alkalicoccus halolimnae]TXF87308.1 tRNA (adenosine(37)-N6)-dimethylallyltransferase MiaA [Alkalicoccus halolimnae]
MKQPLVVVAGPTAVGKTAAAINLAEKLNGEIISGDSMQVYRGMDIGTAKVTPAERKKVPHHLIDILSPDTPFSAADFKTRAEEAVKSIRDRGKLPIVAGGTGMYIQSLIYDYSFQHTKEDEAYRLILEEAAEEKGAEYLHNMLEEKDPEAAASVHFNNVRRVIRALEIIHVTGQPLHKEQEEKKISPYNVTLIGLTMDRDQLYGRINKRVDSMIDSGLAAEVKKLVDQGYEHSAAMRAIGYKEMIPHIKGDTSLEEAAANLKQNSRRYAKRQLTWFRNKLPVSWFDMTEEREERLSNIEEFVAGIYPSVEK